MRPIRLILLLLLVSPLASAGGAGAPVPGTVPLRPGIVTGGMPGSTPLNATPNGCQPGFVQPSAAALTRELNAARARWAASGIRTYRYTFSQVAAPVRFPATEVTVSAGRVLSARPTEPGEASAQARRASVEGLFTFIEQSVAYARTEPCIEIRVTYARAGYPLTWSTEPRRLNIADGNGFWAVTGFTRR